MFWSDVRRGLRRLLAPELVEQAIGRDHLARADDQAAEQRALLLAAERDLPVVPHDLERPEDAELEHFLL